MERINKTLVNFWQTDLHIMGRTYDADAIEDAWWATAMMVFTGGGLIVSIVQTILR